MKDTSEGKSDWRERWSLVIVNCFMMMLMALCIVDYDVVLIALSSSEVQQAKVRYVLMANSDNELSLNLFNNCSWYECVKWG